MQRFGSPTVPGIPPPHAMYQVDPGVVVPAGQPSPQPLLDFHPVIFLFFFLVIFLAKLFFTIYEKTINFFFLGFYCFEKKKSRFFFNGKRYFLISFNKILYLFSILKLVGSQ